MKRTIFIERIHSPCKLELVLLEIAMSLSILSFSVEIVILCCESCRFVRSCVSFSFCRFSELCFGVCFVVFVRGRIVHTHSHMFMNSFVCKGRRSTSVVSVVGFGVLVMQGGCD